MNENVNLETLRILRQLPVFKAQDAGVISSLGRTFEAVLSRRVLREVNNEEKSPEKSLCRVKSLPSIPMHFHHESVRHDSVQVIVKAECDIVNEEPAASVGLKRRRESSADKELVLPTKSPRKVALVTSHMCTRSQKKTQVRPRVQKSHLVRVTNLPTPRGCEELKSLVKRFGHGKLVENTAGKSSILVRFATQETTRSFIEKFNSFQLKDKFIRVTPYN